MAMREYCDVWRGLVWNAFFHALFLLITPGVRALKFLQDPPSLQASHVGWTVDYNCTTDDPNATVSLLHSKDFGISYSLIPVKPNKLLLRKQVFTLVNLSPSDGGNYKCKATDQSGQTIEWNTDSILFILAAQLPRHFVLIPKKSIYVLQGQTGEVTCEAEGPSVSTLKWEKQQNDKSYAAVPNRKVNITKDASYVRATLKIANAQFADTGTYKCTVSVPPNKSDYKLTKITVKGALKFLQDPPSLQASHVGWTVDYNCTTDDPNATVSLLYSKDFGVSYNVISVTPNKLLLRKQVFTLVNLSLSDGGNYKCKATDQSGQTIKWNTDSILFILAAELPRHFVLIPKKSIYVLQGQSGEVTCEAEGPSVSTLKWEKQQNDKSYAAVPNSQVNITKDVNYVRATLKIANAQFADTGTYKCTVSVPPNKSGYKLTKIEVKAPTPPRITAPHEVKTIVVQEGSTKVLKCVAWGAPKPNVTWYKNGKQLHTNDRSGKAIQAYELEVYDENEDTSLFKVQGLRIRSVLYPRDQGEFKCVASNDVSDAQTVFNVQVQVDLVKRLKLRPPENISVLQGQEARIKCDLDGSLTAELEWKKQTISGDLPVPERMVNVIKDRSNNRARAVLKIKFAQMEDSGVYKCVSTVFGKTHFKLAYVTVRESLAFLSKPPRVIRGRIGQSVAINCSTNDVDATVSLLHKPHPFAPSAELKPKANKLTKERQVFTIQNIDIGDAGIYSCGATSGKNQTIKWPRLRGYFVFLQEHN